MRDPQLSPVRLVRPVARPPVWAATRPRPGGTSTGPGPKAAGEAEAASAFRSTERIERLRGEVAAFERLLASLVATLEARVPGTLRHGARVSRIAATIGRRMGLSADSIERMQRGAVLHDIGMLVLPPKFLTRAGLARPGRLDEFQAHTVLGYTLLKGVPTLEPILPFVHRHHERLDGSGFPDGLRGGEIPLAVQIVSIADAFEELTAAAPLQQRLSRARALETIHDEARRGRWAPALAAGLEHAVAGACGTGARLRGARAGGLRAQAVSR